MSKHNNTLVKYKTNISNNTKMSNNINKTIIVENMHYFNLIDNIQGNVDHKYNNRDLMNMVKHIFTEELLFLLLNASNKDYDFKTWLELHDEFIQNSSLDKIIVFIEEIHKVITLIKRFEYEEKWIKERVQILYKVCFNDIIFILDAVNDEIYDYTNTGIQRYKSSSEPIIMFLFYDFRINEMNNNVLYISRNKYEKMTYKKLYMNGIILADIINNNDDKKLLGNFFKRIGEYIIKDLVV